MYFSSMNGLYFSDTTDKFGTISVNTVDINN